MHKSPEGFDRATAAGRSACSFNGSSRPVIAFTGERAPAGRSEGEDPGVRHEGSDLSGEGRGRRRHRPVVPLSLAWLDDRVVVALEADSRTARNVTAQRAARLALGPTRDVVLIDAVLDKVLGAAEAPDALADRYAEQAVREANELRGRTLMRDGRCLV
jgi:hypothetical protein